MSEEENNDAKRESDLTSLVNIATNEYANNYHLGKIGLAKTRQKLLLTSTDMGLIKEAILKSPYGKDPLFEGLESLFTLF